MKKQKGILKIIDKKTEICYYQNMLIKWMNPFWTKIVQKTISLAKIIQLGNKTKKYKNIR